MSSHGEGNLDTDTQRGCQDGEDSAGSPRNTQGEEGQAETGVRKLPEKPARVLPLPRAEEAAQPGCGPGPRTPAAAVLTSRLWTCWSHIFGVHEMNSF